MGRRSRISKHESLTSVAPHDIRNAIKVYLSLLKARDREMRVFFEDKKTGESGGI